MKKEYDVDFDYFGEDHPLKLAVLPDAVILDS